MTMLKQPVVVNAQVYYDEEVTIYPGDQFIVECTYDTTDEEDVILFAESTC